MPTKFGDGIAKGVCPGNPVGAGGALTVTGWFGIAGCDTGGDPGGLTVVMGCLFKRF